VKEEGHIEKGGNFLRNGKATILEKRDQGMLKEKGKRRAATPGEGHVNSMKKRMLIYRKRGTLSLRAGLKGEE